MGVLEDIEAMRRDDVKTTTLAEDNNIIQHTTTDTEQYSLSAPQIAPVLRNDAFQRNLDRAKLDLLNQAAEDDQSFVNSVSAQLKAAAIESAQLEHEKQVLEKQNIEYHQELLERRQKENQHAQKEDKWANREKRRQYHYNGVKDIMEFIGIKTPMAIFILYFLVLIAIGPYLINKTIKGTVGGLLSGADNGNRSKAVRGFLWTLAAVVCTAAVAIGGYIACKWLGIF